MFNCASLNMSVCFCYLRVCLCTYSCVFYFFLNRAMNVCIVHDEWLNSIASWVILWRKHQRTQQYEHTHTILIKKKHTQEHKLIYSNTQTQRIITVVNCYAIEMMCAIYPHYQISLAHYLNQPINGIIRLFNLFT